MVRGHRLGHFDLMMLGAMLKKPIVMVCGDTLQPVHRYIQTPGSPNLARALTMKCWEHATQEPLLLVALASGHSATTNDGFGPGEQEPCKSRFLHNFSVEYLEMSKSYLI